MELERRAKILELDEAGLRHALGALGSIVSCERVNAGLCNTCFRVRLRDRAGDLALRLYGRDPAAAAREHTLLRAVAGRVPVPRIIASGDLPSSVPFLVTEWIEGPTLEECLAHASAPEQLRLARAAGRALATLASFRGTAAPAPGFVAALERALAQGPARRRLGAALAERILTAARRHAPEPAAGGEARLVHADFNAGNLVMAPAGASGGEPRVAAILDWEFARAGDPVFDFGPLLRDEAGRAPGFGDALAAGYREAGGRLPTDWRRRARRMDLLSMVEAVNGEAERPRALVRARAVIEGILAECAARE
jgi:aminoglycoside phosphotransferase (APT) family kinase protein